MNSEKKNYTIALAGNPNCGKSTLFNALTGSDQTIGNWPGVTVEKVQGKFSHQGKEVHIVDLPGIYSLSAHSEDEKVARDYLLSHEADLIVNILDATNLVRNLYLTSQLIEMGQPVILVLNMMDLASKKKITINSNHLSKHLKIPVFPVSALDRKDMENLKDQILILAGEPPVSPVTISYPNELEDLFREWIPFLEEKAREMGVTPRWMAVRLAEDDPLISGIIEEEGLLNPAEYRSALSRVVKLLGDTPDAVVADYKFGMASSIGKEVIRMVPERRSLTDSIDKVVMNHILGIPIFLAAMYLVFWVTINLGGAFAGFFDILFGTIFVDGFGALLTALNAPEWLTVILAGGFGSGIQAVASFVPFIFFMFFMLSLLEDSGYMARAAFVMDRFMGLIGLPGKAFVPMLVGFGCTVPAILATRTLDTRKDRMMTIFMTPLMSCGARLPVYALFAAAFFKQNSGAVVFSLYLAGILLAVLTGVLVRKTLFRGELSHLIMELPRYHSPRMKHILLHTWSRLKSFIIRAGKVIIFTVVVLGFFSSLGTDGSLGNENSEKSLLSLLGQKITPVFGTMGIEEENWPATVGLFTGIFAKESIVGTLSVLYGQADTASSYTREGKEAVFSLSRGLSDAFFSIPQGLKSALGWDDPDAEEAPVETGDSGIFQALRDNFTPASAYAYLLFVLIYFPCLAAMSASIRQMGWGFGLLQMLYLTVLAWSVATLFFQAAQGHHLPSFLAGVLGLGALYGLFVFVGRFSRKREN